MKETLKDFIVSQIVEMGFEDHEGNNYDSQEIFDRFDDFVKDLEKNDLADMIIDYTEL